MTVDELAEHLDKRLDKQDAKLEAVAGEVVDLRIGVGKIETTMGGYEVACVACHNSITKKIATRDKFFAGAVVGIVAAASKLVWDSVTGKHP